MLIHNPTTLGAPMDTLLKLEDTEKAITNIAC